MQMMHDKKTVGDLLREQRNKLGLTQVQCAERAKITKRQYQTFESGDRNLMTCSFQIACRVIAALQLEITSFFHGDLMHTDFFEDDENTDTPAREMIRSRRLSLGLTLKQVADRAGLILQQYQRYEGGQGDLRKAAFRTACKVIEALEMDITAFCRGKIVDARVINNKAIFLDRDGTINIEKDYLFKIEDFEFLPGVIEALRLAQDAGFKLIIITNQSGIARGYYRLEDFERLNKWMLNTLEENKVHIDKVFFCPHHPDAKISEYRVDCECRKPKLGLYWQAVEEFNLDLAECYAIGDKIRDCNICESSECHGFLIGENEKPDIIESIKAGKVRNVKYASDLKTAIEKILEEAVKNERISRVTRMEAPLVYKRADYDQELNPLVNVLLHEFSREVR